MYRDIFTSMHVPPRFCIHFIAKSRSSAQWKEAQFIFSAYLLEYHVGALPFPLLCESPPCTKSSFSLFTSLFITFQTFVDRVVIVIVHIQSTLFVFRQRFGPV